MNLTPEQMNEAVEAAALAVLSNVRGVDVADLELDPNAELWRRDARSALAAALPVLFAAWQEQTAAKAGENPYIDGDGIPTWAAWEAWDEGAAAALAASEERIRRAEETRENANQASVRVELENQRLKERLAASEARVRELRGAGDAMADYLSEDDPCPPDSGCKMCAREQPMVAAWHAALAALLSEEPAPTPSESTTTDMRSDA